ncbi:hypothetical protein P7C71_g2970, partial [Lecanoromycetidae sp. Uapishka_2]
MNTVMRRKTQHARLAFLTSSRAPIGHVTLDLGENHFREIAWGKLTAFTGTLLKLPYGFFTVRNLTINLLRYTFARDDELYCSTKALSRIEVTQSFVLKGLASHLELSVREFAVELQTNKQLKLARLHPQDPVHCPLGYFENIYEVPHPWGASGSGSALHDSSYKNDKGPEDKRVWPFEVAWATWLLRRRETMWMIYEK